MSRVPPEKIRALAAVHRLGGAVDWDESRHPRQGGRFAPSGGGSSSKKSKKQDEPWEPEHKKPEPFPSPHTGKLVTEEYHHMSKGRPATHTVEVPNKDGKTVTHHHMDSEKLAHQFVGQYGGTVHPFKSKEESKQDEPWEAEGKRASPEHMKEYMDKWKKEHPDTGPKNDDTERDEWGRQRVGGGYHVRGGRLTKKGGAKDGPETRQQRVRHEFRAAEARNISGRRR